MVLEHEVVDLNPISTLPTDNSSEISRLVSLEHR